MTIEMVRLIFDYDKKAYQRMNQLIRYEVFKEFSKSNEKGIIFTGCFDFGNDFEEEKQETDIWMSLFEESYVIELEASLDWKEGKISKEEFVAREDEALRCTLKVEKLSCTDEIYLTEMEMLCIRKKIQELESEEKRKNINFLIRFFEWYEKEYMLSDGIVMYESVMVRLAGELANMGDYQTATFIDKRILKESLRCRRIWEIASRV